MLTLTEWLQEYDVSHRNSKNKLIHWICVPAIVFSIMGLIWCLPRPALFTQFSFPLNWTLVAIVLALLYYGFLSLRLTMGMTLVFTVMVIAMFLLEQTGLSILYFSLVVFVVAWIGQFIGHKIEGKKPSFFQDLQFLMIGPLWIMAYVYRKFNIAY